jgi:hypothetical protein
MIRWLARILWIGFWLFLYLGLHLLQYYRKMS